LFRAAAARILRFVTRETASQEAARKRLDQLIRQRPNESYASVSALIGRNHAYIQQYIRRGQPRRLSEDDRRCLAAHFGIPESELGGPASWPAWCGFAESDDELVFLPRFDLRRNTPAPLSSERDGARGFVPFRLQRLRQLTAAEPDKIAVISVVGDSMYPTLADGDDILVDYADSAPLRDGLYALRAEDALQIKRISVNPITGRSTLKSDNPLYESWPDCDPDRIDVVGRVVWVGRKL